ncbi:MFS transporter [Schleiferilactobacillus harbinensis]|uniref:MFS transporter n=1 Tax=Schleiferilactobacillus harbinensis TaxID=304207 RepID=UPI0009E3639F|nr:MFS transporter [Schleiferilactobacillus harbinensis]
MTNHAVSKRTGSTLLFLLVILIGANLRTVLTAVPPILTNIQRSFQMPSWFLGSLTTIPLLCFALVSPLVNGLTKKFGVMPVVITALIILSVSSLFRVYSFPFLLLGTLLIGCAIAVLNVLSPVLVAALYPNKIGMMSSAYLLSSTIFSAASAGFSAPLANILGWPVTLQVLTVFPVVTLIVAIAVRLLPGSQQALAAPAPLPAQTPPAKPQQPVWRQPLAWALTGFMGLQSLLFYTILTWLPTILMSHGFSQSNAILLLGLLQLAAVPMAYIFPNLAGRRTRQAPLIWAIGLLFLLGLGGLMLPALPLAAALVVCILLGFATNAAFTMAMSLFSLKTKTPQETAAVSGMAQAIGYLVAAGGPMLAGFLHSVWGSWAPVMLVLLVVAAIQTYCGLLVDRQESVFE